MVNQPRIASGGRLFLAQYFAGKMPGFGAALGSAFVAALGAMIGGAIWHRYRTKLVPCRQELSETLSTLKMKFAPGVLETPPRPR